MYKKYYETKFLKVKKGRFSNKNVSWGNGQLKYGNFGIKYLTNCFITYQQLESCRKLIVSKLARKGQIWFYSIPQISRTAKPVGDRMGTGKGKVDQFVFKATRGSLLLEFYAPTEHHARLIFRGLSNKLPGNFCCIRN